MQLSLITTSDGGEPVVCSPVLAEGLGISHRALLTTIRRHLQTVERFGRVLFEKAPLKTKGGTQSATLVKLNENQALYVSTLSENTERVVDFKVVLIEEFDKARKALAQHIPTGLIQLINALTEKVILLERKLDTVRCEQAEHIKRTTFAQVNSGAIEVRIRREKIMTHVTVFTRRSAATWAEFWEKFEEAYNVDLKGLPSKEGELLLDKAIRHGYLDQVWEFVNMQKA